MSAFNQFGIYIPDRE